MSDFKKTFPYLIEDIVPADALLDYKIYCSLVILKNNFSRSKIKRYEPRNLKTLVHEVFFYCRLLNINHSARIHIEGYYSIKESCALLLKRNFRGEYTEWDCKQIIQDTVVACCGLIYQEIPSEHKTYPDWCLRHDNIVLSKIKLLPLNYDADFGCANKFVFEKKKNENVEFNLDAIFEAESWQNTVQNISPPPSAGLSKQKKIFKNKRQIESNDGEEEVDSSIDDFFQHFAKKFKTKCLPAEIKKQQDAWETAAEKKLNEVREKYDLAIEKERADSLHAFDELLECKKVIKCFDEQMVVLRNENTQFIDEYLKYKDDSKYFEQWREEAEKKQFKLETDLDLARDSNVLLQAQVDVLQVKKETFEVECQCEEREKKVEATVVVDVKNDPMFIAVKAELEVIKDNSDNMARHYEEQLSDFKKKKAEEHARNITRFEKEKMEEIEEEVKRASRSLNRSLEDKTEEIKTLMEQNEEKDKRIRELEVFKTEMQIQLKNLQMQLERHTASV